MAITKRTRQEEQPARPPLTTKKTAADGPIDPKTVYVAWCGLGH